MDEKKLATLWCASNVSSSKWIGLPMPHEGVCEASVCLLTWRCMPAFTIPSTPKFVKSEYGYALGRLPRGREVRYQSVHKTLWFVRHM